MPGDPAGRSRPRSAPADGPDSLDGALLETFLSLMPDSAIVVDGEGRVVALNERASELFGYDHDALIGLEIERLVPERFRARHRRDRAAYGADPHPRTMAAGQDLAGRRADGTEVAVDISLAPIGVMDRPLVVAAIRDATERRAATAAQAELAAIVQSSLDGIIAMRTDGVILNWNPGAERMLGHRAGDVVGRHISVVIPQDASEDLEILLEATRSGELTSARDTEWTTAEGRRLPVAVSVSPLNGPGGQPLGFSIAVRDITERKLAERETHRLLVEVRRQERWQAANAEIRGAILSGTDRRTAMTLICERACELFEADAALLVSLGPPCVVRAASTQAAGLVGRRHDLGAGDGAGAAPPGRPAVDVDDRGRAWLSELLGSMPVLARARASETSDLALVLCGSRLQAGTVNATEMAEGLANQAALASELERARRDADRLLLAEDRERIARDLHDLVIQRLFASGMTLQGALPAISDTRAAERVSSVVDSLDRTIADIRTAIFALQDDRAGTTHLRTDLIAIASRAAEQLGFRPSVRFEGPVDTAVPTGTAAQVVAVANEAMSNVVRHAGATEVDVVLSVTDEVVLVVRDNGVGISGGGRTSGLANMHSRAAELGGDMEVATAADHGTSITWRVPARSG
jgi:PAS domain S-box-containing protein